MNAMLLWFACMTAEIREPCLDDPDLCPRCEGAADCAWQGNACLDYVDCASVDAGLGYIQIGCEVEHRWPAPDACACVSGTCRVAP